MRVITFFLLLMAAHFSWADYAEGNPDAGMPWQPFSQTEDRRNVFEFFSFSCHFCMETDESWVELSRSVPRQFKMEQVPVIYSKGDATASLVYYAVSLVAPTKLPEFREALYRQFVGTNADEEDIKTYLRIAQQLSIPADSLKAAVKRQEVADSVRRAIRLRKTYSIDQTPTIVVAGKYLTHAGYTGGNYELLNKLVVGLISREMEATR